MKKFAVFMTIFRISFAITLLYFVWQTATLTVALVLSMLWIRAELEDLVKQRWPLQVIERIENSSQ